jgi:hypothetical protein
MGLLGEELGESNQSADIRWIIDPIDGTAEFARHLPLYGCIIGLHFLSPVARPFASADGPCLESVEPSPDHDTVCCNTWRYWPAYGEHKNCPRSFGALWIPARLSS